MTTHASAGKQWTQPELDRLTVENHFRLRGLEVSRLDTFIDAAFAFVLTLLVISIDEIPSSYAEMMAAAKQIPGFATSFAIIMMFWLQHRVWSRRYGLENRRTIVLSLALIFVVLVYVYPLRVMFEGFFAYLSNGYLTASFRIVSNSELRGMLLFYSVGFSSMSLIISQLYSIAIRSSETLALNEIEIRKTRLRARGWGIAAAFGTLSTVMALVLPDSRVALAGHIYFIMLPATQIPLILDRVREAQPRS
ncbi:MAG: DUF1211 domain-containing protein [Gammaproteobacteria bacterium]|nr:DUF1211 domain-containing protein [Gammaproteobacteria bacterium]